LHLILPPAKAPPFISNNQRKRWRRVGDGLDGGLDALLALLHPLMGIMYGENESKSNGAVHKRQSFWLPGYQVSEYSTFRTHSRKTRKTQNFLKFHKIPILFFTRNLPKSSINLLSY